MRTTKELLELLDANLCHLESGLCFLSTRLLKWGDINQEELCRLFAFIENNKPGRFSSWSAFEYYGRAFYWKPGARVPRRKWLEKHIKRL